jgi:glutathione S-transferase
MGEQLTLAETNAVTFMKVIQMLRFLDFWLEPYPMTKAWWDRVSGRPSVQQLDKFASNAVSEDSPHAKAGRETEEGFREKIAQYREQFPHAQ